MAIKRLIIAACSFLGAAGAIAVGIKALDNQNPLAAQIVTGNHSGTDSSSQSSNDTNVDVHVSGDNGTQSGTGTVIGSPTQDSGNSSYDTNSSSSSEGFTSTDNNSSTGSSENNPTSSSEEQSIPLNASLQEWGSDLYRNTVGKVIKADNVVLSDIDAENSALTYYISVGSNENITSAIALAQFNLSDAQKTNVKNIIGSIEESNYTNNAEITSALSDNFKPSNYSTVKKLNYSKASELFENADNNDLVQQLFNDTNANVSNTNVLVMHGRNDQGKLIFKIIAEKNNEGVAEPYAYVNMNLDFSKYGTNTLTKTVEAYLNNKGNMAKFLTDNNITVSQVTEADDTKFYNISVKDFAANFGLTVQNVVEDEAER